jgi:glycosyltransferase involved in cell wall biosynthesis
MPIDGPLRILHVITALGVGGAENMLRKLVRQLEPLQYENHVIALKFVQILNGDLPSLGVSVQAMDFRWNLLVVPRLKHLRTAIQDAKPDVIHAWMYPSGIAATFSMWGQDTPIVFGIRHSIDDLTNERWRGRLAVRACAHLSWRASRVVYCSKIAAHQHEALGYDPQRAVVIPNGFDCDRFRPDPIVRQQFRSSLGLGEDDFVFGNAARYHPMKNHTGLLLSFAKIVEQYPFARLLLIGDAIDGRNAELVRLVHELRLNNHVFLLGPRMDMPRVMTALDAYVSASLWGEGFPNVIGEAMACGVPCVVTDVGDSKTIVAETGLAVRPDRDPNTLSAGLGAILQMDDSVRRRLGRLARKRIETEYSIQEVCAEYDRLYAEITGKARSRLNRPGISGDSIT